jgi:hypothetical protein
VYCGGLTDSRVHGCHGLAAVLTMMTMRWTAHGIAALHRLFGRSHADAIERIRRESDDKRCKMDSPSQPHRKQITTSRGKVCARQEPSN